MRVPLMVGNWKMHKTASEAVEMVRALLERVRDLAGVEVAVAPPFTSLHVVGRELVGSLVRLAAQNMHEALQGPFTGEISAPMLAEAGVSFVILGHSERRQHFGETDAAVAEKALRALDARLTPIICVGETLEEREAGSARSVVEGQIRGAVGPLTADTLGRIVLAYEPVWAIGTGRTATAGQAQEIHAHIRTILAALGDSESSGRIRILYGGSVKPDNVAELMAEPDIDGALVGGASLDPEAFASIAKFRV